jgi:hypothetical protein
MVDPGARVITSGMLLEPESAVDVLGEIGADSGWRLHEMIRAEVVKERPGHRRTIRYRLLAAHRGGPALEVSWYAKQYRGSKGERAWSAMRHLERWTGADFTIGEPIGYEPSLKLLVVGALAGPTLADALEEPGPGDSVLECVGEALASVHEVPRTRDGGPFRDHGPRAEIGVLEDARGRGRASGLSRSWIDRFLETCSVVEAALANGADSPRGQAFLHRDFHPGQIVLRDEGIGILDWDEAAVGEPELDLGNLEAHLLLDDFQRHGAERNAARRIAALRSGYLSRREVDMDRLAIYGRAALLRLATLERLADPRRSVLDRAALSDVLTEAASPYRPA